MSAPLHAPRRPHTPHPPRGSAAPSTPLCDADSSPSPKTPRPPQTPGPRFRVSTRTGTHHDQTKYSPRLPLPCTCLSLCHTPRHPHTVPEHLPHRHAPQKFRPHLPLAVSSRFSPGHSPTSPSSQPSLFPQALQAFLSSLRSCLLAPPIPHSEIRVSHFRISLFCSALQRGVYQFLPLPRTLGTLCLTRHFFRRTSKPSDRLRLHTNLRNSPGEAFTELSSDLQSANLPRGGRDQATGQKNFTSLC